jgi:hypothetical protein
MRLFDGDFPNCRQTAAAFDEPLPLRLFHSGQNDLVSDYLMRVFLIEENFGLSEHSSQ